MRQGVLPGAEAGCFGQTLRACCRSVFRGILLLVLAVESSAGEEPAAGSVFPAITEKLNQVRHLLPGRGRDAGPIRAEPISAAEFRDRRLAESYSVVSPETLQALVSAEKETQIPGPRLRRAAYKAVLNQGGLINGSLVWQYDGAGSLDSRMAVPLGVLSLQDLSLQINGRPAAVAVGSEDQLFLVDDLQQGNVTGSWSADGLKTGEIDTFNLSLPAAGTHVLELQTPAGAEVLSSTCVVSRLPNSSEKAASVTEEAEVAYWRLYSTETQSLRFRVKSSGTADRRTGQLSAAVSESHGLQDNTLRSVWQISLPGLPFETADIFLRTPSGDGVWTVTGESGRQLAMGRVSDSNSPGRYFRVSDAQVPQQIRITSYQAVHPQEALVLPSIETLRVCAVPAQTLSQTGSDATPRSQSGDETTEIPLRFSSIPVSLQLPAGLQVEDVLLAGAHETDVVHQADGSRRMNLLRYRPGSEITLITLEDELRLQRRSLYELTTSESLADLRLTEEIAAESGDSGYLTWLVPEEWQVVSFREARTQVPLVVEQLGDSQRYRVHLPTLISPSRSVTIRADFRSSTRALGRLPRLENATVLGQLLSVPKESLPFSVTPENFEEQAVRSPGLRAFTGIAAAESLAEWQLLSPSEGEIFFQLPPDIAQLPMALFSSTPAPSSQGSAETAVSPAVSRAPALTPTDTGTNVLTERHRAWTLVKWVGDVAEFHSCYQLRLASGGSDARELRIGGTAAPLVYINGRQVEPQPTQDPRLMTGFSIPLPTAADEGKGTSPSEVIIFLRSEVPVPGFGSSLPVTAPQIYFGERDLCAEHWLITDKTLAPGRMKLPSEVFPSSVVPSLPTADADSNEGLQTPLRSFAAEWQLLRSRQDRVLRYVLSHHVPRGAAAPVFRVLTLRRPSVEMLIMLISFLAGWVLMPLLRKRGPGVIFVMVVLPVVAAGLFLPSARLWGLPLIWGMSFCDLVIRLRQWGGSAADRRTAVSVSILRPAVMLILWTSLCLNPEALSSLWGDEVRLDEGENPKAPEGDEPGEQRLPEFLYARPQGLQESEAPWYWVRRDFLKSLQELSQSSVSQPDWLLLNHTLTVRQAESGSSVLTLSFLVAQNRQASVTFPVRLGAAPLTACRLDGRPHIARSRPEPAADGARVIEVPLPPAAASAVVFGDQSLAAAGGVAEPDTALLASSGPREFGERMLRRVELDVRIPAISSDSGRIALPTVYAPEVIMQMESRAIGVESCDLLVRDERARVRVYDLEQGVTLRPSGPPAALIIVPDGAGRESEVSSTPVAESLAVAEFLPAETQLRWLMRMSAEVRGEQAFRWRIPDGYTMQSVNARGIQWLQWRVEEGQLFVSGTAGESASVGIDQQPEYEIRLVRPHDVHLQCRVPAAAVLSAFEGLTVPEQTALVLRTQAEYLPASVQSEIPSLPEEQLSDWQRSQLRRGDVLRLWGTSASAPPETDTVETEVLVAQLTERSSSQEIRMEQELVLNAQDLAWSCRAEIDMTGLPGFRIPATLSPDVRLTDVTVTSGEAGRLQSWARNGEKIILDLREGTNGPVELRLQGIVSPRGVEAVVPEIRFPDSQVLESGLSIRSERPSPVVLTELGGAVPSVILEPGVQLTNGGEWRFELTDDQRPLRFRLGRDGPPAAEMLIINSATMVRFAVHLEAEGVELTWPSRSAFGLSLQSLVFLNPDGTERSGTVDSTESKVVLPEGSDSCVLLVEYQKSSAGDHLPAVPLPESGKKLVWQNILVLDQTATDGRTNEVSDPKPVGRSEIPDWMAPVTMHRSAWLAGQDTESAVLRPVAAEPGGAQVLLARSTPAESQAAESGRAAEGRLPETIGLTAVQIRNGEPTIGVTELVVLVREDNRRRGVLQVPEGIRLTSLILDGKRHAPNYQWQPETGLHTLRAEWTTTGATYVSPPRQTVLSRPTLSWASLWHRYRVTHSQEVRLSRGDTNDLPPARQSFSGTMLPEGWIQYLPSFEQNDLSANEDKQAFVSDGSGFRWFDVLAETAGAESVTEERHVSAPGRSLSELFSEPDRLNRLPERLGLCSEWYTTGGVKIGMENPALQLAWRNPLERRHWVPVGWFAAAFVWAAGRQQFSKLRRGKAPEEAVGSKPADATNSASEAPSKNDTVDSN